METIENTLGQICLWVIGIQLIDLFICELAIHLFTSCVDNKSNYPDCMEGFCDYEEEQKSLSPI